MSMDLCDGSEDDIGERIGVPSLRYAYWAIAETADLVHRAHTRFGFVHADLKPANIMLRRVRLPGQTTRHAIQRLLSDWAFAFDVRTPRRQRPQDGMLFACTPQYSPPEQLGIDRVRDRRSDMYAFGGTAFALLTGKPPNSQIGNMLDLIARKDEIECMTPEDDAILCSCVPGHVADFVGRLLLKNPALRPSSAEARDFFLSLHLATNGTWAIPSNRKAQVFSVRSYLQNVPRAERHVRLPDLTNMADPDELAAALAERFHHDDAGRVYALPQRVSMETPTRPSDAAQPEPQPTTAADENAVDALDSITILYPASSSPVS